MKEENKIWVKRAVVAVFAAVMILATVATALASHDYKTSYSRNRNVEFVNVQENEYSRVRGNYQPFGYGYSVDSYGPYGRYAEYGDYDSGYPRGPYLVGGRRDYDYGRTRSFTFSKLAESESANVRSDFYPGYYSSTPYYTRNPYNYNTYSYGYPDYPVAFASAGFSTDGFQGMR